MFFITEKRKKQNFHYGSQWSNVNCHMYTWFMPVGFPSLRLGFGINLLRINLRAELKELYIFSLLFSFASALITVFEPVFFYKEGFSLSSIALYYALHYTLYIFLLPLGGKFAARFGLERSISFSLPVFIVYFLVLALLPKWPQLYWVAIPLLTIHKIFYWPAFHAEFTKFGDTHNRGTEISWMTVLKYGVGISGPLIGGFVAYLFGFPILFLMAATLVLLSAVPLLRTRERYRPVHYPYSAPWRIIISRRYRNMTLAMLGMGENLIDLVFWPVFMFIILGSTEQLGIVASINLAVMTVLSFFVGEMSDRLPRRTVLRMYLPFMIVGYLFRPLAGTVKSAALTDTLNRMAFAGVNIPMLHRLYVQGKPAGALRYTVAFEVVLSISKALTAFALAIVFAFVLPYTGFTVAFVTAAVLALFYVFL